MSAYRPIRPHGTTLTAVAALLLYGCGPTADSPEPMSGTAAVDDRRLDASAAGTLPVSTVVDARPAAMIDGRAVTWGDLRPALSEAAGATALEELALRRLITDELVRAELTIGPDDIAAEQKRLVELLDPDPNVAVRLLNDLRRRDQLGPRRYQALLWRNAALRALVQDDVVVTEDAVKQAYEIAYGRRRQARLATLSSLAEAQAARELIEGGAFFGDVAVERSTDGSAARGGLLEPIARHDPAYPEALRRTLWTLEEGQLSSPILLDNGYAILQMVGVTPRQEITLAEARPRLEKQIRLNQERLLMDQLARRLLNGATITVFDDELNESWKWRRK